MRTKEEILNLTADRREYRQLEVLIDIRDLLKFFLKGDIEMDQEIEKGLKELGKVPVSQKE